MVSAITWCMETMEIFLGFLEGFLQEVISRLRFRGWRKIRKLGRERAFQEKEQHRDSMCKGAETQRTQHRSPYGERRCGLSSVTEGRKWSRKAKEGCCTGKGRPRKTKTTNQERCHVRPPTALLIQWTRWTCCLGTEPRAPRTKRQAETQSQLMNRSQLRCQRMLTVDPFTRHVTCCPLLISAVPSTLFLIHPLLFSHSAPCILSPSTQALCQGQVLPSLSN